MIYTCTLNPSIDYIMNVEDFQSGGLNRANETFYYPGGKGINVSRVMKRVGIETTALGFTGGFTGAFIESFLNQEQIHHQFIQTNQPTRVNVKLKSSDETEINGPGPLLSENMQQELLNQIESMTSEDTLVLAGSVPASLPDDFYMTVATTCKKKNVKFIADTSGKALKQLIGLPVFLLKPNHHELGELFDTTIDSPDKAALYGQKLVNEGAENVIVSMGGQGAVYVGQQENLFANVPKGEVKNSVGAGDSLVAGFTAACAEGKEVSEAFRYGVAAGSATAFQDDLCQKEDIEKLIPAIQVSSLRKGGHVS
ncbi:1-phosphofructokinase [Halobacillus fulvus]|nr:1-phosphofructokinase [Halobacillus fulvus]